MFQNQRREHVPAPKTPIRTVLYPTPRVSPADGSRKPVSNSQIPDPMISPHNTCFSCGSSETAVSSAINPLDTAAQMKEPPQITPSTKPLKPEESPLMSENIQVAEVSSSDISEKNKELRAVKNPLDILKPIESGDICSVNELPPTDSISNLESLIEKVPKPERFPVDKTPMADEEVEKLYALSRQNAFYGVMPDQGGLRTKWVNNLDSKTEEKDQFLGLNRHKSFSEKPQGIPVPIGPRPKRSSNLQPVPAKIDNLYPVAHQNSCEKTKVIPGQFVTRQKRASTLESSKDDLNAGVQYARPIIINESKRKQHTPLILHSENTNLYTNENLKKSNRRHSIGAVSRNTLTPKANLKEPSVPYLECRIKRESKSLPGNVFEEPRIVDSTTTRLNSSLRGVKRRHSSITHTNDESCATGETCAKRRTRSEDRPNPIDENDPANQKHVTEEVNNRLRWSATDSSLSRPGERLLKWCQKNSEIIKKYIWRNLDKR